MQSNAISNPALIFGRQVETEARENELPKGKASFKPEYEDEETSYAQRSRYLLCPIHATLIPRAGHGRNRAGASD